MTGKNSDSCLCAIDVGTTGARVMIFDLEGNVRASHYEEYSSIHPKPAWVEQHAEQWWEAVCNASKRCVGNGGDGVSPEAIAGIAITNQRETIVPVDEHCNPLRNAIVWQDRRSTEECNWLKASIGEDEIYKITGLTIDPYFSSSKILWMKNHEYGIFNRTHKFLLVHDYILAKLTGQYVTDYSNASRTMLFDIHDFCWSSRIVKKLDIETDKLPAVAPSGQEVGVVSEAAAAVTGLRESTPVVAGGGDQQCAALGVGVTRQGRVKATTGTGTFILSYLEEPVHDPDKRVLCSVHCIPDRWVLEASVFTTGAVYRWFRDNFSRTEIAKCKGTSVDPYDLLNKQIEAAPAGSGEIIVLPHFVGAGAPYWNPTARGVVFGLALGHTRNEFLRAIMEGICYEIRKNLEVMESLGVDISELRVTGGATKASVYNQIQADVLGRPVLKPNVEESTALGAAILAGVGSGVYDDVAQAAESMVSIAKRHVPTPKIHERYSALFEVNRQLYDVLLNSGLYGQLNALQ